MINKPKDVPENLWQKVKGCFTKKEWKRYEELQEELAKIIAKAYWRMKNEN